MMTPRILGVAAAAALLAPLSTAQTQWPNVALPTTFQPAGAGFSEDFETAAGVVPSYMALTAIDVATGLADPEAWCNIGQNAACLAPNGGLFSLEMGLLPGSTNYHDVRNVMVLGLDGQGTTQFYLDFAAANGGEETDVIDGIKVSDDGIDWYDVVNPWSPTVASGNVWRNIVAIDLSSTPADLSGQFYLMVAQEDNFPFVGAGSSASDGMSIDDIAVTLTPTPPPPLNFSFVNLPTTFEDASTFNEDFEAAAGVLQPYMAVTEVDGTTLLPDPNVWANIGQNGAYMGTPYAGAYYVELTRALSTSGEYKSGLVFGLNGATTTDFRLNFQVWDNFDETDDFDGIFVSDNGTDWHRLYSGHPGTTVTWIQEIGLDMSATPANVSGDFYLLFGGDDNTWWSGNDGIGYDNIFVGPVPGELAVNGNCGYVPSSVDMSMATPGGTVALAWGFGPGSAAVVAPVCSGTVTGLDVLNVVEIAQADANGNYSFTGAFGAIPFQACGVVSVQAIDITTCLMTNVIDL